MSQQKPDFSALNNLPKVNNFLTQFKGFKIYAFLAIGVSIFLFVAAILGTESILWALPAVLLIPAVFYSLHHSKKTLDQADIALNEFAQANNFSFVQENKHIDEKGSLFRDFSADNKRESRIISGSLQNFPFKMSDYHYETYSGKQKYSYDIRVMRLTLPRRVPHMVVDCLVEKGKSGVPIAKGGPSTLPINFDSSQKLELEGDFYKFFTLYAPDKYAVSALTVIAPDIMDTLMRMKSLCDIEIIDNCIYFYWPDEKIDRTQYQNAFETVEEIMKKVGDKLARDNIFATASQAKIHTDPLAKSAALKSGLDTQTKIIMMLFGAWFLYIFGGSLLVALGVVPENTETPALLITLVALIPVAFIIYGLIKKLQKRKLRQYLKKRHHG